MLVKAFLNVENGKEEEPHERKGNVWRTITVCLANLKWTEEERKRERREKKNFLLDGSVYMWFLLAESLVPFCEEEKK